MSARAIIYRANYLGLISPQQYRTANVYLNKSKQTKIELYDKLIQPEQPEVLTAALDTLNEEIGLSVYDIADQLGISVDIIAQLTGYDLKKHVANSNVISMLRKN